MSYSHRTSFEWYLPMPKSSIIFFVNFLLLLWSVTLAKTLQPILWDKNSSNFTATGLNITVEINDLIDIKCPQTDNAANAQYHKFTQVSYQGYQQCSLEVGRKRHLLSCNRPFLDNKLTLLFQEYTPYPGGATFSHGEEYYFITTSNGTESGIDNTTGGLCQTHNMKLRVYIKPKPTASPTTGNPHSSTSPPTPSSTTSDSSPTSPRLHTTPRRTTTSSPTTTAAAAATTTQTTHKTTETSTTKANDQKSDMLDGTGAAHTIAPSTFLILLSWLVAVVRWCH